jgi:citrate synthase
MPELGLDIEGTILGRTRLSHIDGNTGRLIYCGYDIHDLAKQASWEEVVYLLWHESLPSQSQLADMRDQMATARCLDGDEMAFLRSLPLEGHEMDVLRTVVSALPEIHPVDMMHEDTVLEQGLRITAKLPTILATLHHLRSGEEPIPPNPNLDHVANMLWMLHGKMPDEVMLRAMNTYMIMLAENSLNISTFVAAIVASTQTDLYAALTAALAAMRGIEHGTTSEYVMRTFEAIGTPEKADNYIDNMLSRNERLMGVGHRIFKVEDPRVRHLREESAALAARPVANAGSHAIAQRVEALLGEKPYFRERKLFPNAEFYSAPLLYQLGFPFDFFTPIFACARMPGWIAHIREQLFQHRLLRPEATYVGATERQYVPLEQRVGTKPWR